MAIEQHPDELEFEECGDVTVDEGGEGIRSYCDYIQMYRAEVPGGFLYMGVRTPDGASNGGVALAFVPNVETRDTDDDV